MNVRKRAVIDLLEYHMPFLIKFDSIAGLHNSQFLVRFYTSREALKE